MKSILKTLFVIIILTVFTAFAVDGPPKTDWEMVSKIREEGFQHSQVMDMVGYMTDVLGARITFPSIPLAYPVSSSSRTASQEQPATQTSTSSILFKPMI